jgi:Domain of unknown function (DUF4422)
VTKLGIDIFTIHHIRENATPSVGVVTSFVVGEDDASGDNISNRTTYADWRAHYFVWRNKPDLEIVGFQGYRKHINFRDALGGWTTVPLPYFREYQSWLRDWDGIGLREILGQYDILVTDPFDISYNLDMTTDFKRSASASDWEAMMSVMRRHGVFDYRLPFITSHSMYVTKAAVFRDWMAFWWSVVSELEPLVKSPDPGPRPDIYVPRAMAFLSERIFSIWLHSSGLKVKTLPLLTCWDAK